jgi:hypothetical protein
MTKSKSKSISTLVDVGAGVGACICGDDKVEIAAPYAVIWLTEKQARDLGKWLAKNVKERPHD